MERERINFIDDREKKTSNICKETNMKEYVEFLIM